MLAQLAMVCRRLICDSSESCQLKVFSVEKMRHPCQGRHGTQPTLNPFSIQGWIEQGDAPKLWN